MLSDEHIMGILEDSGAVLNGHFVLKNRGFKDKLKEMNIPGSGDHSGFYVNKDALFPFVNRTMWLGTEIAEKFADASNHF